MKKLAYLLSLVVIMLTVAPCCALEDHMKQLTVEKGLKKQGSQANDCCQACGTCRSFMALPLIGFSLPSPSFLPTPFNNTYLQSFADGIITNIWQPPKLS